MLTGLNHAYMALGNTKQRRHVSTRRAAFEQNAHGGNIGIRKLGFCVSLSNAMLPSIKSVLRVFEMRTGYQVRWIYAKRGIA